MLSLRCHTEGMAVDLDELLKKVRSGAIKELTLSDVTLPDCTPGEAADRRNSIFCNLTVF